jgi:hypothetical protein
VQTATNCAFFMDSHPEIGNFRVWQILYITLQVGANSPKLCLLHGPIHDDHWHADNFHLPFYCESFCHSTHVPNFCSSLNHGENASIGPGLNWCWHLCAPYTLKMKSHISSTYQLKLQPSVEIKFWWGIPDSVDQSPCLIFMHHRTGSFKN